MKALKVQILKHTVLATVMSALSPVALLNIGKIIGKSYYQFRVRASYILIRYPP